MKPRTSWALRGIISLILLLFLTGNAFAQQLAAVRVTVTDPNGNPVPGANISLKNTQTGIKRTSATGENGLAVISDVPPGAYELAAEATSFVSRTFSVQLLVGQVASFNVALGLPGRAEKIEVRETVQGVELEKAELSQVIETNKIENLPIQGREFIDFALLTPSVSVGRSTAVGAQSPFTETVLKLSFAGIRESHTTLITQDGLDYTTSISGVQRVTPSQDWVQEFRVVSSPYTTDTGRSLGSLVNTVIKSGTNDLHGAAYEYFRNNKLNANNLLSQKGFRAFRFNQFGADLGGPIVRDKLFFFTGYEGQRRAESPVYSAFILNAINGINAVKQFFGLSAENLSSILQVDNYDKFIGRANANLNTANFLNITYVFNDVRKKNARGAAPGEGLPSSYRDNPVRDQTVYGNLIHVGSPNLTFDTSVQFGRRTFHLEPVGAGFEPAITIPDLLSGGGFVGSFRFYQEKRVQVIENVSYSRGSHSFKFGGEFHQIWSQTQDPLFSPGFAIFSPGSFFGAPPFNQPTALFFLFMEPREFFGKQIPARDPNFQNGLFAGPSEQIFDESARLRFNHQIFGVYAQDTWKIRPNFTLSFGLRYEFETIPSAQQAKLQQGGNHFTDYRDVQPRASFAYSFHQRKGVVRGGYGIFTAPFVFSDILVSWIGASEFQYMNQPLLPQFQDPQNRLIGLGASGAVGVIPAFPIGPGPFGECPTPNSAFSQFAKTGAYPAPTDPGGTPAPCLIQFPLGYAQREFRRPTSQQASLEAEHQIGKDWFVSAGYQYVHAFRLPTYLSINGIPNGATVNGATVNCPPPVPGFPAGKAYFCPNDFRFGFALFVTPQAYSIYHGGTLSLRKQFSNHFSVLANYVWSKSIDIETTINLPNTPENFQRLDLDRAVGDNHIPHRFTLALLGEAPNEWRLLRDFRAGIVTTLQKPRRFTVNTGFDTNGDLFPFSDRVGLLGRNTYIGDGFANVDLRIQRGLKFNEHIRGELSAEFFNLFNKVNVEDVDHVYGAPDFVGPVPKHFGDGVGSPSNPSFGSPKFVGPARQIQLSFRVTF